MASKASKKNAHIPRTDQMVIRPNGHKTRSEDQTIKVRHNPAHKPVAENAGAGPSVIVPYMHVYKAIRK